MSRKNTKTNKKEDSILFQFTGVKVEDFSFNKKEDNYLKHEHEEDLSYELLLTFLFKKETNEGIIKINYIFNCKNILLISITINNYFIIEDIAKYLDENNKPVGKLFENFIRDMSLNSIAHSRALLFSKLDSEESELKKFTIPFINPEKIKEFIPLESDKK